MVCRSASVLNLLSVNVPPDFEGESVRLHCYWEARGRPPAYLVLSVTSWLRYAELQMIDVINHSNMQSYVGAYYDLRALRRYSLPKQSDAVSAAVLYQCGGLFLDVDTLLVNDQCTPFIHRGLQDRAGSDEFVLFGVPDSGAMHIAVISATPRSSVAAYWTNAVSRALPGSDGSGPWNHLGNAILEPYYRSVGKKAGHFEILDKDEYGVIAESFSPWCAELNSQECYGRFWFEDMSDDEARPWVERILSSRAGMVLLHNSWTPLWFSRLTSDQVLSSESLLGRVLREISDPSRYDEVEKLLILGGKC